jgi:6-pyruvoyltetrahydropterin/6-carboxytetrahydropterin synthase
MLSLPVKSCRESREAIIFSHCVKNSIFLKGGSGSMRDAILTKSFRFEAAHHLPGHRGKCAYPHGHSYRLEVSLRGSIQEAPGASDDGMVMDLEDLGYLVNATILEERSGAVTSKSTSDLSTRGLDHSNLNELTGIRTTAENLAHWIWDALVAGGLADERLYRIRLYETETSYVEITHDERRMEEA